jgi:hypothetical protein
MSYSLSKNTYNGTNLFEVTPFKEEGCGLFPNQAKCKVLAKPGCFACTNKMFVGRPVIFEYSPDTLPNWKSGRCNNIHSVCANYMQPSVL